MKNSLREYESDLIAEIPLNPPLEKGDLLERYTLEKGDLAGGNA